VLFPKHTEAVVVELIVGREAIFIVMVVVSMHPLPSMPVKYMLWQWMGRH